MSHVTLNPEVSGGVGPGVGSRVVGGRLPATGPGVGSTGRRSEPFVFGVFVAFGPFVSFGPFFGIVPNPFVGDPVAATGAGVGESVGVGVRVRVALWANAVGESTPRRKMVDANFMLECKS